ncbi:MAG: MFS transporter [Candidatus Micrarchaeaceae archaeon]
MPKERSQNPKTAKLVFPGALAGWTMDAFDLSAMFLLVPVLAAIFFPAGSSYAIIGALSIYFISLVFRPLGGLIFGKVGDRVGRKYSMIITLLGLGTVIFATGLLPTYASAGALAVVLLVALRILTGIFAGGEYGNSAAIMMESAPSRKRGLFGGMMQTGYPIGYVLAAIVFLGLHYVFPGAAFIANGWRWMFFIGIIPALAGLAIRLKMPESTLWMDEKKEKKLSSSPIKEIFLHKGTLYSFLTGALAMTGIAWVYSLTLGLYPTILSINNFMPFPTFIYVVIIAILSSLLGYLLSGYASDRIGRRLTIGIYSAFSIALALPLSYVIMTESFGYVGVAIAASILAFLTTGIYGVIPAFLSEKFPTKLRSTGVGISFNGGFIIGSWSSVLMLLVVKPSSPVFFMALGVFVVIGELFILSSALLSKETVNADIRKITA